MQSTIQMLSDAELDAVTGGNGNGNNGNKYGSGNHSNNGNGSNDNNLSVDVDIRDAVVIGGSVSAYKAGITIINNG